MVFRSWKTLLASWLIGGLYIWGAMFGPAPLQDLLTLGRRHNRRHKSISQRANDNSIISSSNPPTPVTPNKLLTDELNNSSNTNPFVGQKLFIDPNNPARLQADKWRGSRPDEAALLDKIGNQPVAVWLGSWQTDIGQAVTENLASMELQSALPVFVLYNIPNRDCGSYSAGGANTPEEYRNWVKSIQSASQNSKAVFLLEPDALPGWDCLSVADRAIRSGLLQEAVATLTSSPNHYIYIDAGNTRWQTATEIANRLASIGTSRLTGFTLNVSNFLSTSETKIYAENISNLTGRLHFVIDSSRNGQGPASDLSWCNPEGRGLGESPQATPNNGEMDALLWIKYPGESDGSCNGAPESGVWMPDYALGLARRAAF